MRKKLLSMLLAAAMLTGMLTGCGSDEAPAGAQEQNESVSETKAGGKTLQDVKDAGKLKVGCKVDVPKFGYQNTETGEYEGLEIDLAYEVAADIFGVTADEAKEQKLVEFQGVTAKTRGPLLDNGEIDMVIATYTITDERKESWNFSTPYMEDALGLMCLSDAGYSSMADLDGAIIGVAQGATTKDVIAQYIEEEGLGIQVEYQEFDGYPALNAALSAGNIDVFSVDRSILAGYKNDTTTILPERFGIQEYGIATALSSAELANEADKVVNDLKDSGKLDEMIARWEIE